MPMMAAHEQNDARNSARMLASLTLRTLDRTRDVEELVMVNMFRLLDDYRAHGFYGVEDVAPSDDEFGATSMLPSGERNFGDVRHALEKTIASLGVGDGDVIENVEGVLRTFTYPELGVPEGDAVDLTKKFLTGFIQNLQTAYA